MTHHDRVHRMRRAMEEACLDALVLRFPENVLLLSGFWPMIGAATLVFPREGDATLIAPGYFSAEVEASLWHGVPRYYRFGVLDAGDAADSTLRALTDIGAGKNWRHIGYEASF